MGLPTPASQTAARIHPRLSLATVRPVLSELRRQDLPHWNHILLRTDASLYQYPFWNEPYRPLQLTPRYLIWGAPHDPLAFVCLLTVGFGPVKIGMAFRGPVCLQPGLDLPQQAIAELLDWARAQGFIFIRFTHSDPQILTKLAASGYAEDFDAFPYFLDYPVFSPDYIVPQSNSDEETLASLDREARRKIRRATELGYEFRSHDSPEALKKAWPLYCECAHRKQFRLERPLSVYMEIMRLARPLNGARLYSAHLEGRMVGSTLVFRDRSTAHCQLAAFEREHRICAAALHWHSMRDMYRLGALLYNLGPGPGSLARFKQQFCSNPVTYPGPLTVVLKEDWFRLWRNFVFPVAKRLRPTLRAIVSRLKR